MSTLNIILGMFIHIVVPALGVLVFALLVRRMWREEVPSPPVLAYFILFSVYGAWLVLVLASIFGMWSGMASIGTIALVFVAPFVILVVGLTLYDRRLLSVYHWRAYVASVVYVFFMTAMIALMAGLIL